MTRDNRIKVLRFDSFAVIGSTLDNDYKSINGEILKISFNNITTPGSFWIAESGTDVEFYRKNNITSGLSSFEVYPRAQVTDSVNTTLDQASGNTWTGRVSPGPLYIAASGLTSGTGKVFGPVNVMFR